MFRNENNIHISKKTKPLIPIKINLPIRSLYIWVFSKYGSLSPSGSHKIVYLMIKINKLYLNLLLSPCYVPI
jgi:hypothetical protein